MDKDISNCGFMEVRPHVLCDKVLLVAASLTGGNVLTHFAESVSRSLIDLGLDVPDNLMTKLITAGMLHIDTDLIVRPTFQGERHCNNQTVRINFFIVMNFAVGKYFEYEIRKYIVCRTILCRHL